MFVWVVFWGFFLIFGESSAGRPVQHLQSCSSMRFSIILLKYASMGKYLPLFHPEDAAFHVSVCDDILNVHCSPESSSHAASSLHDRALTFVDGTVLTDNDSWMFLSPCCDLHERIRPVFIPSFSRFSESFGDIMCCEW